MKHGATCMQNQIQIVHLIQYGRWHTASDKYPSRKQSASLICAGIIIDLMHGLSLRLESGQLEADGM